jgi:hypothetical protein
MTALRSSFLCGGVRLEIDGTLMQSLALPLFGSAKGACVPFRTRARDAAPSGVAEQ